MLGHGPRDEHKNALHTRGPTNAVDDEEMQSQNLPMYIAASLNMTKFKSDLSTSVTVIIGGKPDCLKVGRYSAGDGVDICIHPSNKG